MRVHVFGDSPSPAVASHGLRQSVQVSELKSTLMHFVIHDFYVMDICVNVQSNIGLI